MHALDLTEQVFVSHGPGRRWPGASGTICGGGELYLPTYRLDPEAIAVLIDKRAHLGRGWSSPRAMRTARSWNSDGYFEARMGHDSFPPGF